MKSPSLPPVTIAPDDKNRLVAVRHIGKPPAKSSAMFERALCETVEIASGTITVRIRVFNKHNHSALLTFSFAGDDRPNVMIFRNAGDPVDDAQLVMSALHNTAEIQVQASADQFVPLSLVFARIGGGYYSSKEVVNVEQELVAPPVD